MNKPFRSVFPVTQEFGETITDIRGHTGMDFALPMGTPVLAADSGLVWKASRQLSGYGTHVILIHAGSVKTVYGHLSELSVRDGQRVASGQVLGISGCSGNSTGPHLHFEVREGDQPVDPRIYIGRELEADEPEKPAPARWRVLVDQLYVRTGPGIDYPIVDSLIRGTEVLGGEESHTVWLCIGPKQWIAVKYKDQEFCAPPPEAVSPPTNTPQAA